METVLLAAAVVGTLYVTLVVALLAAGRRTHARAWAGFIPDCVVLVRRLLGDLRVPRRRKLLLGALVVYLAFPLDLVPDFIPIAGQLDDAIALALVLRLVLRSGGEALLAEHWPGPSDSLRVVRRLAFAPTTTSTARAAQAAAIAAGHLWAAQRGQLAACARRCGMCGAGERLTIVGIRRIPAIRHPKRCSRLPHLGGTTGLTARKPSS